MKQHSLFDTPPPKSPKNKLSKSNSQQVDIPKYLQEQQKIKWERNQFRKKIIESIDCTNSRQIKKALVYSLLNRTNQIERKLALGQIIDKRKQQEKKKEDEQIKKHYIILQKVKKKFLSFINKKNPQDMDMTQNYFLKVKPVKQRTGFGVLLHQIASKRLLMDEDSPDKKSNSAFNFHQPDKRGTIDMKQQVIVLKTLLAIKDKVKADATLNRARQRMKSGVYAILFEKRCFEPIQLKKKSDMRTSLKHLRIQHNFYAAKKQLSNSINRVQSPVSKQNRIKRQFFQKSQQKIKEYDEAAEKIRQKRLLHSDHNQNSKNQLDDSSMNVGNDQSKKISTINFASHKMFFQFKKIQKKQILSKQLKNDKFRKHQSQDLPKEENGIFFNKIYKLIQDSSLASFIETRLDSIYQSTKGAKRDLTKLDQLSKTVQIGKPHQKHEEQINFRKAYLQDQLLEQQQASIRLFYQKAGS